jgi:hypothetical protein
MLICARRSTPPHGREAAAVRPSAPKQILHSLP